MSDHKNFLFRPLNTVVPLPLRLSHGCRMYYSICV